MKSFDVEQVIEQLTLEEKAQMCSGRDFWHTQNLDRLGIPSIMMCDGPNGLRKQIGEEDHLGIHESIETVCYPTESAFASSFDLDLLYELGKMLGQECQAEHVGMLLGPGINIKRSPLCGRNFEYFSEDPYLSGKLATAYIKGLQSQGIAACVKHFAANNQETRRLSGSSEVDERTLHEIYLPAFEEAVKDGKVRSVMCAYNAVKGTFCAENGILLRDVLRDQFGFDGFVVTDWGAIKNRVKGLLAGVDLEMPGSTEGKTAAIMKAVEDGSLKVEILDEAVRNILRFVKEAVDSQKEQADFDRDAAHKKAGEFAKECAVLLKNDGILPLKKDQKIAFIGEFAEKPRFQGAGSSHVNVKHTVSALECVNGLSVTYVKGYEATSEIVNEQLVREAKAAALQADVAVIFAGLPEAFESEGADREHLRLPENQNHLITEILKVQKNTVVVLYGGSVMELPWEENISAVLCMHLGGDHVGKATVELLLGEGNPSGKLAESWPVKVEDNPSYLNFPGENGIVEYHEGIFVGYRYYDKKKMEVKYPFGHGLSYTEFLYSDLQFDKKHINNHETLKVSCKVRNNGKSFGKEVVQLYTGVSESTVRRPKRELKGFQKIALYPGEEKKVEFYLTGKDFAYYETKIHNWFVESGKGTVEIGSSSRDIRLSGNIVIESDMELPIHFYRTSTIGELAKTVKGREVFEKLLMILGNRKGNDENAVDSAMGEGSKRMRQVMMMEMPLNALVTYGIMKDEALEAMLENLNEDVNAYKAEVMEL